MLVDGACYQLLPSACFARNQYCRVRGSDAHDAGKDSLQSGRGSHNLLKHEDLIDLLSQRDVLLPSSFFRLLAIVDVGTRRIPADDLSSIAQQWVVLD